MYSGVGTNTRADSGPSGLAGLPVNKLVFLLTG
jgi:hypothetical protein